MDFIVILRPSSKDINDLPFKPKSSCIFVVVPFDLKGSPASIGFKSLVVGIFISFAIVVNSSIIELSMPVKIFMLWLTHWSLHKIKDLYIALITSSMYTKSLVWFPPLITTSLCLSILSVKIEITPETVKDIKSRSKVKCTINPNIYIINGKLGVSWYLHQMQYWEATNDSGIPPRDTFCLLSSDDEEEEEKDNEDDPNQLIDSDSD